MDDFMSFEIFRLNSQGVKSGDPYLGEFQVWCYSCDVGCLVALAPCRAPNVEQPKFGRCWLSGWFLGTLDVLNGDVFSQWFCWLSTLQSIPTRNSFQIFKSPFAPFAISFSVSNYLKQIQVSVNVQIKGPQNSSSPALQSWPIFHGCSTYPYPTKPPPHWNDDQGLLTIGFP